MKIATYNIQNLFHRDKHLIKEKRLKKQQLWNEELEALFAKEVKIEKDYVRMRELVILLGFNKAPFEPYVSIKNMDGNLMFETPIFPLDNRASNVSDWEGWIKLATDPLTKTAILNKARVIIDVNPDILVLQEVENRTSLVQFNDLFLKPKMKEPYIEVLHMDGNDHRGKGIGILLKKGYRLIAIRSYADEKDSEGASVFDVNTLQFRIRYGTGQDIFVFCCQLSPESNSPEIESKRNKQAEKIAAIYKGMQTEGCEKIIILGNLNAPSYSSSLSPLVLDTDLRDISKHNSFEADLDLGDHSGYYRMGGYRKGINIKQKDYLLLSPLLFEMVRGSGLNRKALWPSKNPKWPLYESVKKELDSASDFPLIWVELSLQSQSLLLKKSA